MLFPARRLQPGIFAFDVELFVRGIRPGKVEFRLPFKRVQPEVVAAGVAIPGMRDVFLDLLRIAAVYGMNFVQVAIQNRATGKLEVVGLSVAARGQITIGQIILQPTAVAGPLFVEARDRHQVGNIDLFDKFFSLLDEAADMVQPLHIDGVHLFRIERARHPAHQVIRVRVLAAENGMDLHDLLLPLQRFQIMRHRQQIHFRR